MEPKEIIENLREQLKQVEAKGHSAVEVKGLYNYLNLLEKDADDSTALRKLEHEGMLADHSAKVQHSIEMLRAVLEAGKSALHSIIIINGGAVVALLGVMSSLVSKQGGEVLANYLALPLLQFGLGVLSGAVGFAFRYFSQACYSEAPYKDENKYARAGDIFRYLAIAAAISGYVLFGFAIVNSYHAAIFTFKP